MKKYSRYNIEGLGMWAVVLLIFFLFMNCLCSCIAEDVKEGKYYEVTRDYVYSIEYQGHEYLQFGSDAASYRCIVHNPDCPCQGK